jgi:pilus assembly protein TadC
LTLFINFLVFISAAWAAHHLFQPSDLWIACAERLVRDRSKDRMDRLSPYLSYLQQKMTTARWTMTPERFISLQLLTGAAAMILAPAGIHFFQNRWPVFSFMLLLFGLFFIIGLAFPLLFLLSAVEARQKNMVKDLSYYLDLMTLGVEAGLDYLTVLARVMENSKPGPLKEELETMVRQVRMGKSRSDAWREFSNRISLPEVHSLILVFIQTDQIGSPLSAALRHLSEEIKTKRFQLAEKRAYQMPVKMLIPLLGCIFPAVFILIFEPLISRFLQLF